LFFHLFFHLIKTKTPIMYHFYSHWLKLDLQMNV
jgi:hypothetical protein